ncbi:MAG: alpha/beta hydrolase [Gemmatimonadota bacterium]
MHRIGLVAVLFVLAGSDAGAQDLMGDWVAPQLDWAGCDTTVSHGVSDMECASLTVPVDWGRPSGPSIELQLARVRARHPLQGEGLVLALSGGPGGSGIDDLPYVADALPEVLDHFDLLGHEPRTALALRTFPDACMRMSGAVPDLPEDSANYERILAPLRDAVERCRRAVENGLVDHLDGRAQALDVEAIRRAVGVERLNLTAQSYGGVVVAAYARMFPDRIRTAYVDGVISHPDLPHVRGPETQEGEFRRFAAWCEASRECALFGEDVVDVWVRLTEKANRSPIPGHSERFGDQRLSGAQLQFLTRRWRDPGADHAGWVQLSRDIDRARRGDASPFVDWALGNLMAWATPINVAMQCPDGAEGTGGYREFRTRMKRYREERPLFYGVKLLGMICGAWPIPLANPPAPLPGRRLPPFLGAGTVANDLAGTAQFLEHIPGSVVISVSGSGHVVYLGGASDSAQACVSRHLTRYLMDLTLPPPGTRCGTEASPEHGSSGRGAH